MYANLKRGEDTEQRGATLITIGKDGAFCITPYRLMDLED